MLKMKIVTRLSMRNNLICIRITCIHVMCLLKTLKQSCPFLLENSDKHMKYLTKFQKDLNNNSPL